VPLLHEGHPRAKNIDIKTMIQQYEEIGRNHFTALMILELWIWERKPYFMRDSEEM